MGTGSSRVWNTAYVGGGEVGKWGWGTGRDYRETRRNRERRKLGNPGVEEVGGWVGGGGGGGGVVEVAERSAVVGERKGRKGWQRGGNNETPY